MIIIDIIWIVPMFILSIYCAIYEARYGSSVSFNQGAFGAASVSFFFNFFYNLIANIHMVNQINQTHGKSKKTSFWF